MRYVAGSRPQVDAAVDRIAIDLSELGRREIEVVYGREIVVESAT